MWIVCGTRVNTQRVPGGAKVDRHCDACGETATFYEKEVTGTFRLYFIDLFDYKKHRVMACGCCGACYATDELGTPAADRPAREGSELSRFGASVERAADRVGEVAERAATAMENTFSRLVYGKEPTKPSAEDRAHDDAPAADVDRADGDDAGSDPLKDDDEALEARFRELERKVRIRTD